MEGSVRVGRTLTMAKTRRAKRLSFGCGELEKKKKLALHFSNLQEAGADTHTAMAPPRAAAPAAPPGPSVQRTVASLERELVREKRERVLS